MNTRSLLLFASSAAVAFAAVSEEVHPDWSQLSGTVTIAAGVTNLVEETDIEHVNRLSTIAFASATSAIRFTGATAYSNVTFSGSGTIIKDSDYDWTLFTAASGSFNGHWIMKGGIVTPMVNYAFGSTDGSSGAQLWIESGATLKFVNEMKYSSNDKKFFLYSTRIHIAGTGKDGKGAIWVLTYQDTNQNDIKNIILEGDATIFADGASCYYYHNGTLKMNGHKLTIIGTGDYYTSNCTITGGGEICVPTSTSNTSRSLCLRGSTNFKITDGVRTKVSVGNKVTIDYREGNSNGTESLPTQEYALEVSGTVTVYHNHQFKPYPFGEYNEHGVVLAGPVTLKDSSSLLRLRVDNAPNCSIRLLGEISGPGGLEAFGVGRVILENAANSFAGRLSLIGSGSAQGASLQLLMPGCAPDFSKVVCSGGRISLVVKDDGSAWTMQKIMELANSATFNEGGFIGLDQLQSEGTDFLMPGTTWAQIPNSCTGLSPDGTGTVTVTTAGLNDGRRYSFGAFDGTLRLTGNDPIAITNLFAAGSGSGHSQEVGTVIIDGVKPMTTSNAFVTIGNQWWNTSYASKIGYMTVTNSFVMGTLATDYGSALRQGGIFPGWYGYGLLTIEPDSVVTSNFMIAYGNASSRGAVHQRGGTVAMLSAKIATYKGKTGVIGNTGYGYYELSDGTLDLIGRPCISSDSGQGILAILGGTATLKKHFEDEADDPWLVLANSGNGHLYIKGGKANMTGTRHYFIIGYGGSYKATLTMDGPDAHLVSTAGNTMGYNNNGTLHINLNSGTLESVGFGWKNQGYTKNTTYMNFNGGTMKCRNSSSLVANSPSTTNLAVFTLYPGGAYIDTNGKEANIPTPVIEAKGMGISEVPLPAGLADKELIGSPVVLISGGDGFGAQAYADYDSKTRRVTGAHVICPGHGYTVAPTATFKMGSTTLGTSTCTLAANTPGDFVKSGTGTLTLNATNEYSGTTCVLGGTLMAGTDWAISTNSPIVLKNGGTLNLNSKLGKVKSLTYGVGGGTISNATNAEVPADFGLALSVEEMMAGGSIPLSGSVDLTGKTLTVTGDMAALDDGATRHYRVVTGTALSGMPSLVCDGLSPVWIVRVQPTALEFARLNGTSIVIR